MQTHTKSVMNITLLRRHKDIIVLYCIVLLFIVVGIYNKLYILYHF